MIILAAAAGSYWFFIKPGNSISIEYRFDQVKRGDISLVVSATGTLEAVTTVEVGSQVSGRISRLYADYNTVVHKGDVIAQLDPTFLEAQVKESEANLARAEANLRNDRRVLKRQQELFNKKLISQAEYDQSLASYEASEATVNQLQASLDRARVNLRYATIRAPIDGVIISRNVDVGQTVAASLSAPVLFVIANDLKKMQVQASVSEADIGQIYIGQQASFTVDAYPDNRFSGRVSEVRLEPIIQQNVVNYIVIIDVPNPDLKLMPGMTATVTILVQERRGVLRVPNLAVRFRPPKYANVEDAAAGSETREEPPVKARKDSMPAGQKTATGKKGKKAVHPSSKKTESVAKAGENNANPFKGMSREEIRKKMMSMSPEERKELREKFVKRFSGMRRQKFQPGRGTAFSGFDRDRLRNSSAVEESGPPPRALTKKLNRDRPVEQPKIYPGKIWVLTSKGTLKAVPVKLGISDGMYTELVVGDLREGEEVIVGAVVTGDTGEDGANNPFGGFRMRRRR